MKSMLCYLKITNVSFIFYDFSPIFKSLYSSSAHISPSENPQYLHRHYFSWHCLKHQNFLKYRYLQLIWAMKLLNSPCGSLRSKKWRISIEQTVLKWAFVLLASIKLAICQDFDLVLSTYSINQFANYQVYMLNSPLTGYAIPSGAIFLITFPQQYNITALRNKAYSGYDASAFDQCPIDPACGGVSVSFKANGFEISGLFTSPLLTTDSWTLAYTIFNILNPSTISTVNFAFTIYKGTAIYYPLVTTSSSTTSQSFIAGTPSFTYQVINPYIWGISPLKFIITPNNLIDSIRITFPNKWASQLQNFPPLIPTVTCSSVSNPAITCSYLSYLTVSNLSYFTVGQPIDLTVNSIYNPSTVMPAGSITLTLYTGASIVESSQFSIASSYFSSDILRNPSASLTYLSNDFIQLFVTFQIPVTSSTSDRIYVTFPSEISIPLTSASYTIRMKSVIETPTIFFNSSLNTISFNMVGVSLSQVVVSVTATGIARPRQCKNLSSFVVKSYRSNLFLMDSTTCCTLSLENRLTLTINSITAINPRYLKSSSYVFSITTNKVNLITSDSIQIVFPSQYSNSINSAKNATICSSISILGTFFSANIINSPGSCNTNLNIITLSSFISSNLGGSETLTITIVGIMNPSTSPAAGFTISTLSSANYVLQAALNFTISLQPNTFAFGVLAGSYKTCQQNVVYNFSIANNSPLSNGYSIWLYFPIDYSFINYNQLVCTINNINYNCGRANSTYHTSNIIVVIRVESTLNSINFVTVSSVTNPISYATTGTFSAIIKDHTSTATQSSSGNVTVAMTSEGNFALFTATANNYSLSTTQLQSSIQILTSQGNSVWLTVVLPFTPVSFCSIKIIMIDSNKVSFSGISVCKSQQTSTSCSISNNAGNVEILLNNIVFSVPSSNFLKIQITNLFIKDYFNLLITATLTINSFPSLRLASSISFPKLYSQYVSNYNLAFSNTVFGQVSTATMTILFSATALSLISSITIYIPLQFSVGVSIQTYPISSLILNQITIPNLINPTVQKYTPFLFSAQDSIGNVVAISSPTDNTKQYSFYRDCNLYCRTCSSPSVCIDCYIDINWIEEIYLRNSTKSCVAKCQEGQYLNNGVCYACDANCLSCLMYQAGFTNGISNYCLTCSPSTYLNGSTCVAGCPTGYYSSYNICELCPPNCLNCTSAVFCTSCQTPYSLYGGYCLETCPNETVSVSDVFGQFSCQLCPNNCKSCSSALSPLCLSCSSNYYLYNGACYSSCSLVSLFSDSLRTCVPCQCNTCINYSSYCTSCNSTYNLYMNQCILNCPTGYFPLNNTCIACSTNCIACTSLVFCTICQIPMAVYKTSSNASTCVSPCPNTTITTINPTSLYYTCQSCNGNCLTCSISITFCLSCKNGFVLNNNTCVQTCPLNKYLINGACRDCALQCRVCLPTDPYNCSVCSPNYFNFNDSCGGSCPSGRYTDISTLKCLPCNSVCSTCLNSTNCTSCANGYYLSNYFCYPSCISISPLLYSYNGTCLTCQPQCTSCISTPFQCSSCVSSSYYFNPFDKSCSLSCISPYYINGTLCSTCQSPCSTCDTLFDSCLSCTGTLSVLNGLCYNTCPDGYYSQSKVCTQCPKECLTCSSSTVCMACQNYAYRYYKSCVLNCKNTVDLQITIDNFCTSCASVPYCQTCQAGTGNNFVCFICVYPYVIFQGNCLNQCPDLYVVDNSNNTCVQSADYSVYLNKLYEENYPYFPPFCFIGLYGILSLLCYHLSKFTYKYSYHYGYLIALLSIFQQIFLLYGFIHIFNLYKGDYTQQNKQIPLLILAGSEGLRIILTILFISYVVFYYYSNDMGFREWRAQHTWSFRTATIFTFIFGTRFFKLYYSKFMGKSQFSYQIISVQKFYPEDLFTWLSFIPDLIDFSAFTIVSYNIFITYSVLYVYPFQLLLIKGCQWIMLLRDLKKPDRGFFLGQEEEAQRMIQLENEQREKDKRKFQMESLVKLIRRKSAANLHHQKLYEHLFFDDFRSVYNPDDYQQVPKMPNRRIPKALNKGKFRKGKKITIQQKLKRFAESIKPSPIITKDQSYLRNLLYWKPPKQINIKKKQQVKPTDESMLKLLQDKEMYYDRTSSIQVLDIEDDNQIDHDGYSRIKPRKYTNRYADEQTVFNEDPSSLQYIEREQESDVNQLFNRNYAKRQHLPSMNLNDRYDDNDLRVLYHQPLKKRKSKLNQIRSRYY